MLKVSDFAFKILLLSVVLAILPQSPFQGFSSLMASIPYISYLNWFLPISEMIVILESWLAIVAVYYSILYVLNYVGVLKS